MCTRKICKGSTVLLSNLYDPWSYITTTSYIILQNEEFLIPCYWLDKISPNCYNNDRIHDIDHDPYYHTLPNHSKEPPKILIGEPSMVTPNSIEAVRCVMPHVQDVNHLNEEHHEKMNIPS